MLCLHPTFDFQFPLSRGNPPQDKGVKKCCSVFPVLKQMTAQQAEESPRHGSQNLSFNGAARLRMTSGRLPATTYAEAEWIS